jgi:two-component system response regulator MprA
MRRASRATPERHLNAFVPAAAAGGTIRGVEDARVLVVEDDDALRAAVARGLRESGLEVTTASDGTGALATVGHGPGTVFSAVVLDIGLPDADGRDVCLALRARGIDVPVLFLTARDQPHDLLAGFAAGGDDYLAKPFRLGELVARLRVAIRRGAPRPLLDSSELRLDPHDHALHGPAGRQPLTPTEFRLLATLLAGAGGVIRRRELVRAGWPDGAIVADNTLDQYVARLRRKVTTSGATGLSIETVRGVGYRCG